MVKRVMLLILLCSSMLQAEESEIPQALVKQVEAGHAESAFFIGTAFAEGAMGIEQNLEKARQWFLKSAEMGYVHGMFEVGKLMFSESLYAEARDWFQQAADQGHGEAYYRLSIYPIYELAEEPFDCQKAYELLKEAQLRDVKAAFNDHAWMLSTLPDAACRNGQIAWRVFAELQELYGPTEPIPWAYLDTKAAVFAEIAEFNEAIEVQSWIVEDFCQVDFDAEESRFSESLNQLTQEFSQQDDELCLGAIRRLQAYVNRTPWREKPEF